MSEQYCFKCASHICTCGALYKSMSEKTIYKIILACQKALNEKSNKSVEIKINDKYVSSKLAEIDMKPLFSEEQVNRLRTNTDLPKIWNRLFDKANTLQDLKVELEKHNEETFPLIGLLMFMIFDRLNERNGKSSIEMFMGAVKEFYPRETPLRDIIELCGNNYKALKDKLDTTLKFVKEQGVMWDDNFSVYAVISIFIQYYYSGARGNNVQLMYRLLQCIALGSTVDLLDSEMNKLSDELCYVDETLYKYMKQYNFPVESASIKI